MCESNNKSTGVLNGDNIVFPEYMSTEDFHKDCVDLSKYNTAPLSTEELKKEPEEDYYEKPAKSFFSNHNEFVSHDHETLYKMIDLLIESGYDEILLKVEDFNNISLKWIKSNFGTKYIEVDNN